MSGKKLIQLLKKHDWILDRISGSHHIMRKENTTLSVPVHGNTDLKPGILDSLLKKAGLK
jgi:predicted RNA binding protein YcfA (HicA-like mRNA interferase family)